MWFNQVSLLNSHLSLSLFFIPFSSILQERERDLVFVLRDYNVTCFKIADVLIAVLGAYQMLKLKVFFPPLSLFVFLQSILVVENILALIQSQDVINSWVDLVVNLKHHQDTCDNSTYAVYYPTTVFPSPQELLISLGWRGGIGRFKKKKEKERKTEHIICFGWSSLRRTETARNGWAITADEQLNSITLICWLCWLACSLICILFFVAAHESSRQDTLNWAAFEY